MEKEGLYRVIEFLQNSDITLEVLVTDRHKQINKWLREKHPEIIHYYDIWHVAKSMHYMIHCSECFIIYCYTCRFTQKVRGYIKEEGL